MITITIITVYSHHIRAVAVCSGIDILTCNTTKNYANRMDGWNPDANYIENNYQNKENRPRVGLNHQPFG